MKNLIIILIAVFSFQFTKAQDFKETKKYIVVNELITKQQEYASALFNIVAEQDTNKKVTTLDISDLDFFEDITISTLSNPNLENINEIIKVDVNYVTCCARTETYYFLATNDNNFISLPHIENMYCDNTASEVQYIFPSQPLGKEDTILKTEVHFTEAYIIKDTVIQQSFVWNDNNFNNEDAVSYLKQ